MSDKMILGAQLFTVRDYMKNEEDFAKTMDKIAKIGYKYVQVSGIGDVSPKAIKKAVDDTGLKVILTHTNPDRVLKETDAVIEEHSLFGCDGIGIGGIFNYRPWGIESFKRFADDYAPAIEKITKAGKKFLYHNHKFEFERCEDGKLFLEYIMNASPDLMLTFDTYWAQAGGADPAAAIEKYAPKIFTTHLKDMRIINDAQVMAEVGEGNMNFDRIIDSCIKAGIKYHMVEQDIVPADPFESLEISYKNIMARYGQYFE
ncbi:MAG: sugar phosphate isomerase/epimerase [Clostridiales bacterium]|nr:sugar phosphate isomerase/epimerase [Clostridiales bacterium]